MASEMPVASEWRRFEELWPLVRLPPALDELSASALAVDQGAVGDCHFLGPLSALAFCRPQLVHALFVGEAAAFPTSGKVTLRFYVHGAWAEVTVDTLLPCGADGRPLFSGRAGPGWAAILEKGYAKLAGGYAGLDGGRAEEATVDLTGGCCERHRLEPRDGRASAAPAAAPASAPTAAAPAAPAAVQATAQAAAQAAGARSAPSAAATAAASAEFIARVRRWQQQGHLLCCRRTALPPGAVVPRLGQPAHTYCVLQVAPMGKHVCARLHSMAPAAPAAPAVPAAPAAPAAPAPAAAAPAAEPAAAKPAAAPADASVAATDGAGSAAGPRPINP